MFWDRYDEGIGSGYKTEYKVSGRKDIADSVEYSTRTYSGYGSYTGYPNTRKQSDLQPGYRYSVTEENADGLRTTHTFDNKGLRVESVSRDAANAQLRSEEYQYSNNLPIRATKREYNAAGQHAEYVEMAEYNAKGQALHTWGALAGGTKTDEHKTSYTYDPTYGLILTSTYKRGPSQEIEKINTLSPDKKTVSAAETYENGSLKQKTGFTYTSLGQVASVLEYKDGFASAYAAEYSYDQWGNMASVTSTGVSNSNGMSVTSPSLPTGSVGTQYVYDIAGRLLCETGRNGDAVAYSYDAAGKLQSVTAPDNSQTQYLRNYTENTLTVTDAAGSALRYEYDALGNETSIRDMQTQQPLVMNTYDQMFRLKTSEGPAGTCVVSYEYDILGRLLSRAAKESGTTMSQDSYSYDEAAAAPYGMGTFSKTTTTALGSVSAPSVVTTEYIDIMGNVACRGFFLNGTEHIDSYGYDYLGSPVSELTARDASNNLPFTTQWEYDFAGRITKETNALGQNTSYTYDALGNPATITDRAGNTTVFTYGALGRLLSQSTPFEASGGAATNSVKHFDYDPAGNIIRVMSQNNAVGGTPEYSKTEYAYDARGLLTTVLGFEGGEVLSHTAYTYDVMGNATTMSTGLSGSQPASVNSYEYDRFGNVTKHMDALGQEEIFTYDLSGNLKTKLDRNGTLTQYAYDGLNRLAEIYAAKAGSGAAEHIQSRERIIWIRPDQNPAKGNKRNHDSPVDHSVEFVPYRADSSCPFCLA